MSTFPSLPNPMLTRGIDISRWSGARLDFPAFKAEGFDFVICRASVGRNLDATFEEHVKDIILSEMVPGSYHGFWDNEDPEDQALFYHKVCKDHGLIDALSSCILPMNDWEEVHGVAYSTSIEKASIFSEATETLWNVETSFLYTFPAFMDLFPLNNPHRAELGKRLLSIAHYGVAQPRVPSPWTKWDMWQHAGNVVLHNSLVDLDCFNGSLSELPLISKFQRKERFGG